MSPGQKEFQKLVSENIKDWPGDWVRDDLDQKRFYSEFKKIVASNKIINNDPITSASLKQKGFSSTYLTWVSVNSNESEFHRTFPSIRFDGFDYESGRCGFEPRYLGGRKFNTTFSCLFSLHQKKKITAGNWRLQYIESINFSTTLGNGNHRSLAHCLIGEKKATPYSLLLYSNGPNDSYLNECLLKLDKACSGYSFKIIDYRSKEEIEKIKGFFLELSKDEETFLLEYLRRHRFDSIIYGALDINILITILNDLKGVLGHRLKLKKSPWYFLRSFMTRNEFNNRQVSIEKIIIEMKTN